MKFEFEFGCELAFCIGVRVYNVRCTCISVCVYHLGVSVYHLGVSVCYRFLGVFICFVLS